MFSNISSVMDNSVSSRESRANDVLTSLKFVTHDISSKNNPSKKIIDATTHRMDCSSKGKFTK